MSGTETWASADDQHENELVRILAAANPPPSRLRVHRVTVEVEWAQDEPAAPGTARRQPRATTSPDGGPAAAAPVVVSPGDIRQADSDLHYLCAPTVGTFYRGSEPGASPFVSEGSVVSSGQQVAIIEVMKLMIPVEAEAPGRVVEILKPDAASVEHGEQLFVLTAIS
jgi:acetyl-CoA carboxylase biotin carboxyl carrier protein